MTDKLVNDVPILTRICGVPTGTEMFFIDVSHDFVITVHLFPVWFSGGANLCETVCPKAADSVLKEKLSVSMALNNGLAVSPKTTDMLPLPPYTSTFVLRAAGWALAKPREASARVLVQFYR